MPFSADRLNPPLHDQVTAMQRKIQLLEEERTAEYESSQATIKKNKDTILRLRHDNKSLYRQVAEAKAGDEHVIKVAFHNRGVEKEAYRNMSGKEALTKLEQEVLSKKKRLNALKHTTQTQQRHFEELKEEYKRMKPEAGGGASSTDARTLKNEEDAMRLRALENSLEKTHFKDKEATNIMINYQKLKSHLQEESLTFEGQLDNMEAEILKQREELHKMQALNNNAQLCKEAAQAELQQLEESLYKERKDRDRIIASYRKRVEECKAQAERRAQRTAMQPDELGSEAPCSTPTMAGEEDKATSTYEEAFRRLKEASGLTDLQEIVERFNSQKETHQLLQKMKAHNEKLLQQQKEQMELLSRELQDMKYSGEAKRSSDQEMLEEREQQLQVQQQRCDQSKEHLDFLVKTVNAVRAWVEHLTEKLLHIAPSEDTAAEASPDSDEFVLELMNQCQVKLLLLQEQLHGKDLSTIKKEMEEFFVRIEGKLPAYNTRVKLPEEHTPDLFNDEEESEEDEAGIITREMLKRQSQLIVDKSKRKKKGNF
ncbi:coiled-coil domain-containing protein 151 [Antennarius striatus]|uniref:coiled-coil domain-containing protein 151 n=1 Tax=Antennarius striatus TaxID=241820 RepID=UPI0035AECB2D